VDVGYRGWLRSGRTPARPFGFGLGWTTWSYGEPSVTLDEDGAEVVVEVTNTGPRAGRETVQAYLAGPAAGPQRPVRWLAGFTGVDCAPGETVAARVRLPRRAFEVWDTAAQAWAVPSGDYQVIVGRDLADERGRVVVRR
jgi:beta-glucosidase